MALVTQKIMFFDDAIALCPSDRMADLTTLFAMLDGFDVDCAVGPTAPKMVGVDVLRQRNAAAIKRRVKKCS